MARSYVVPTLLGFVGVLLGHWLSRRSATGLGRWRSREETMRMLRWATEIALDDDSRRCEAGVAILGALLDSPRVDPADEEMLSAVAASAASADARGSP